MLALFILVLLIRTKSSAYQLMLKMQIVAHSKILFVIQKHNVWILNKNKYVVAIFINTLQIMVVFEYFYT